MSGCRGRDRNPVVRRQGGRHRQSPRPDLAEVAKRLVAPLQDYRGPVGHDHHPAADAADKFLEGDWLAAYSLEGASRALHRPALHHLATDDSDSAGRE